MNNKINVSLVNMLELNLCLKSAVILYKMNELQKWVHKINVKNEDYFALSRKELIVYIPTLGSIENVSRLLKKLKDEELIGVVYRRTRPYCRVTKKGLELLDAKPEMFKLKKEAKVSDGKFTFKLAVRMEYDDLNSEYLKFFNFAAHKYLKDNKLPSSEFEKFINHNLSIGATYKDWGAAFKNWCAIAESMKKNYAPPVKEEGYFSKV